MASSVDLRGLQRAREAFLSDGTLPETGSGVPPEIVASWQRSLRLGAQPTVSVLPYDDDLDTGSPLLRSAAPILEQLAAGLAGEDVDVILCDHTARIVARWNSHTELSRRLDAIHAEIGVRLDEAVVGTNGVGTVVEECRPRQVTGAQHLADGLSGFSCAGAPIRHPVTGRLLGVLDLTCAPQGANRLLLAMAVQAACRVEDELLQNLSHRDRVLVREFRAAVARSAGSVVLIAEDLYMQDRRAANLLEATDHALLRHHAHEILARAPREEERMLPLACGAVVPARLRSVESAGDHLGAIVEFRLPGPGNAQARPAPAGGPAPVRSTAGRSLEREAGAHAASTLALLARGEVGTGKFELIRAMHPGRRIAAFDGTLEPLGSPADWFGPLQASLRDPEALTVIRRLDGLSGPAARALAALLEAESAPGPYRRVAATMASGSECPRALLDQFPLQLDVPALRDRFEDIPDLVTRAATSEADRRRWTPEALRAMCDYRWPGNLRQLRAVVRSVTATGSRGEVTVADLPGDVRQASHPSRFSGLQQMERTTIVDALRAADGSKTEAARTLGIGRATLYRKIKTLGIDA